MKTGLRWRGSGECRRDLRVTRQHITQRERVDGSRSRDKERERKRKCRESFWQLLLHRDGEETIASVAVKVITEEGKVVCGREREKRRTVMGKVRECLRRAKLALENVTKEREKDKRAISSLRERERED